MDIIWTLIVALIVGCIVGPLARLILPGKQNLSVGMTVLLGAVGALVGAWIGSSFLGTEGDLFSIWGIVLGTIFAIVAVLIYGAVTGRDSSTRRIS